MTIEILFLLLILATMAFFFFTEKLPVDLTAFAGLVALLLFGFLEPSEAFTGFSSPAVITMLSIFFVSGALLQTGVADMVGDKVHHIIGSKEVPLMIAIMAVSALLSAFMNNIAAAAVLLPAVASLARAAKVSPSRLFMPLSFGAILGGTTTLVGTPPNIIAAEMLEERGLESFSLFDFTPMGLSLIGVGIVYMITVGRKLLPDRDMSEEAKGRDAKLDDVYQLKENIFSIRIPQDSRMNGLTLKETRLGSTLDLQVVGILRDGKTTLAPMPTTMLHADDVLVVKGSLKELNELMSVQEVEVEDSKREYLELGRNMVKIFTAHLGPQSALVGSTVRKLHFRSRFRAQVVGLRREGKMLDVDFADVPLCAEDDLLLAVRHGDDHRELDESPDIHVSESTYDDLRALRRRIFTLHIKEGNSLAGQTVAESRLHDLVGVTIVGIMRENEIQVVVGPGEVLKTDDHLYVVGEPRLIRDLVSLGKVSIHEDKSSIDLESEQVGIIEATVAPRGHAVGKTLAQLNFRELHGLQVLSIWREGKAIHSGLANLPLQFGDALLLQGPWRKISLFSSHTDFLVLSNKLREDRNYGKAPFALGALALMIFMVVTGLQPIHVAAFTAATAVVLSGALTMQDAYRLVEWRAIFLVAAVLPVGIAMERTGAASLLAHLVTDVAGPLGPYAILAGLCLLASLLSQCLDGAPSVVLLTPVALQTAETMGISAHSVMMGVSLSASAAFMTPFSHKANLLVMGAGGYRVADYLKVGTPLTIILIALKVVLIPIFFPF